MTNPAPTVLAFTACHDFQVETNFDHAPESHEQKIRALRLFEAMMRLLEQQESAR